MFIEQPKTSFRETSLSYVSGILFTLGWWLWIDAVAYKAVSNDPVSITFGHWVPAIVGTVGLFMVNALSWTDLQGFGFGDEAILTRSRIWLFASFTVCFSGIIASIWIAVEHWFNNSSRKNVWPGVALILQNLLIFFAAISYRFAKPSPRENPF